MMTSPPRPPSPPEGPPRGTYFSRRKATQPLPPSPAFRRILASSTNTGEPAGGPPRAGTPREPWVRVARRWRRASVGNRGHADEAATAPAVFELDVPGDQREQRVVLALPHVFARLVPGAALANQNGARVHQLPAEALHAQPLAVRIAAVGR